MRRLHVVLALLCVLRNVTAAGTVSDEQQGEVGRPSQDVCGRVGNALCGSHACVALPNEGTFFCDCGQDHFYDVRDATCAHVQSCTASRCQFGICSDEGRTVPATCDCTDISSLTPSCEVTQEKKEECSMIGAIPSVGPNSEVDCLCRPGEVFKNDRCLPTTCLNFSNTCEQLCKRRQLNEDHRCCQGWEHDICTAPEVEGGYCKPGYIKTTSHERCIDACSAGETNPVCPSGCTSNTTDGMPYNCVCGEDQELAHHGLGCIPKTGCSPEEKAKCREDQECVLEEGHVAACKCPANQLERNGQCSGNCTRECQHTFASCRISDNQEQCQCSSPLEDASPTGRDGTCVLEKYAYLTSFKLNRSLASWKVAYDCRQMKDSVMEAFSVLFGSQFLTLDIISCKELYRIRLIFSEKQDQAVLNRLHLCKNSMKPETCYFWPDIHVVSGSVGPVAAENICETVLREPIEKYEGGYVCKVQDDEIHFNCVNPAAVSGTETSGRITKQRCSEENKLPGKGENKGREDEDQMPPSQTAVIVGAILAILAALGIIAIIVVSRKRKAAKAGQRREKYEADLQQ
uniref:Os86 protein n=1 Tax=Ornithodoros savignyi TaxID=69826 RepID=E5E7I8_ORNSA|nr:Os86 protein [Ornithodoros savignyi]